jgi:hypothetical protein
MTVKPGDRVTYLGHEASVMHVFTLTANIRLAQPVRGLSRQQDVPLSALLLAACRACDMGYEYGHTCGSEPYEPAAGMTRREALDYISRHDQYVRILNRKSKPELRNLLARQRSAAGVITLIGGPASMSKDELINELTDMDFPRSRMDAARQVYYAAS